MKVLVYPYDVRVPKVRISTRQAEDLRGHRIVVRIDSWEVDSQYPNGHFVRSIGPIGSLETETNVILIEHSLSSNTFSKALLSGECAIMKGMLELAEIHWVYHKFCSQCVGYC